MISPIVDYDTIPEATMAALDAWVKRGQLPGGFLCAVLRNDLMEAISRADTYNLDAIRSIVGYVYNECPDPCWGSQQKMYTWQQRFNKSDG